MAETTVDVFVAVGSNIDPERNIVEAFRRLKREVHVTGVSTFYRTEPLKRPEQPPFLNGVWRLEASMPVRALKFDCLRAIEAELGRVRTVDKWAPRTIDLDVILYGDLVIDEPDLKIPDPDIRTRPFIAIPLLELAPDLVLPDTCEHLAAIVEGSAGELPQAESNLTERLRREALENPRQDS